jgi:hypothetical protein
VKKRVDLDVKGAGWVELGAGEAGASVAQVAASGTDRRSFAFRLAFR